MRRKKGWAGGPAVRGTEPRMGADHGGSKRHLLDLIACGGELEVIRGTTDAEHETRETLDEHVDGIPGLKCQNGSTPELVDIASAFALATYSAGGASGGTWMSVDWLNDRRVSGCALLGEFGSIDVPDALVGATILRWFGLRPRKGRFVYLACYFSGAPPARAVFAARAAVITFFLDKRLRLPRGAPDWLVTGKRSRPPSIAR